MTPRTSRPGFGLVLWVASTAAAKAAVLGVSSTAMSDDEGMIGVNGTSILRRRDEVMAMEGESEGDPGADKTGVTGSDPR